MNFVIKNGRFVIGVFGSWEDAWEVAELEQLVDPSARIQVEDRLPEGEGLTREEIQELVGALLERAVFSDLRPELWEQTKAFPQEGEGPGAEGQDLPPGPRGGLGGCLPG